MKRNTLSNLVRSSVRNVAVGVVLAASGLAYAGNGGHASYNTWVDVVSVTPRYATHYVNESVERCYDVRPNSGPPAHARGRGHGRGNPYYSARHEQRGPSGGDQVAATVIGGVIGGVVGNQFGGGSGKKALTVAGAVIGASVANSAVNNSARRQADHGRYQQVSRRCDIVHEPKRVSYVDGYEVTYRYHGQRFTRVMDHHPGDRMQVRVDLQLI